MREILFRGKSVVDGSWRLGNLFVGVNKKVSIKAYNTEFGTSCTYHVSPDSVGQFTGKKDQDSNMLFEHDLVYYFESNHDEEDGAGQILWDEDSARFIIVFDGLTIDFDNCYSYQLLRVGNIHDNPELLDWRE